ncbi:MAG: hypothetical protein JXQ72_17005 [Anaerolineae bacterium]|nr:hypothetical protein [Anaerolineae bacterium]
MAEAIYVLDQSIQPVCVILDLELNDGSGTAVLDRLRFQHGDPCQVVVVSGQPFRPDIALETYDVAQVLCKPVSPRALTALVRNLVRGTQHRSGR